MPAEQFLFEDDPAMFQADAEIGPALCQLRVKLGLDSAMAATNDAAARTAYQRALLALAQALGYRGAEFKDLADARRWFDLEATVGGPK